MNDSYLSLIVACGLVGGAWLGVSDCDVDAPQSSICNQACDTASACGLFPSALATSNGGKTDCTEKCELSNSIAIAPVLACLHAPANAGSADAWCGAQPVCTNTVQCLTGVSASFVPVSDVTVTARIGDVQPFGETCLLGDDAGVAFSTTQAMTWCAGFTVVVPFVEQNLQYSFSDALPCTLALTQPVTFSALPAGATRAGLEVYGPILTDGGAGDGGEGGVASDGPRRSCWVFHGDDLIVSSGTNGIVAVSLPEMPPLVPPFECERSLAACSDGVDNDGDGKVDCADTKCATFSVCAPPRATAVCVDGGTGSSCDGG